MTTRKTWAGTLIAGVAFATIFAAPSLRAETAETPSVARLDLPEAATTAALAEGCDLAAETPPLDFQTRAASSASASAGTFYICFGGGDFLCGGCPVGTRCATEACGPFNNATCTFRLACVTSCQVSPGCQFIGNSCQN